MQNRLHLFPGLILIFCVSFLVSCGGRPSNVLPEDKMVKLMVDMELAEAYYNTQSYSSNSERLEIGKKVLEAHNVSEESLDTTLAWYGRNMDKYTDLFEKVDKEILKRRQHYTEIPGEKHKEPDNLWPYSTHLILSELSGQEALVFSLPNMEVEKGSILDFSFYLPNVTNMRGTLGVEYKDGYGDVTILNNSSKNKVNLTLQTDTAREVDRIFGVMNVKDFKALPLYIDSISLKIEPIDSTEYRSKQRQQKKFGIIRPQPVKENKNDKDSGKELSKDSGKDSEKELGNKSQSVGFEKLKKNN